MKRFNKFIAAFILVIIFAVNNSLVSGKISRKSGLSPATQTYLTYSGITSSEVTLS